MSFKPKDGSAEIEVAFVDPRRLGRVRLCQDPLKEHPISSLGFDPILSMPPVEEFHASMIRRSCPVKALLLDQSFSAGVGNWVAGMTWDISLNPAGSQVVHSTQMKFYIMHGFTRSKGVTLYLGVRVLLSMKT